MSESNWTERDGHRFFVTEGGLFLERIKPDWKVIAAIRDAERSDEERLAAMRRYVEERYLKPLEEFKAAYVRNAVAQYHSEPDDAEENTTEEDWASDGGAIHDPVE